MIEALRPQAFETTHPVVIMAPREGDEREVHGVLNPAAARGPDGQLYLFPRLVGNGNYSRIGIARVIFNQNGDPCGVERLGIALEPTEPYEKNDITGGGCEDPRVVYLEPFQRYIMTYTAFSSRGARIAAAVSRDLMSWERIGLVRFEAGRGYDFNNLDNKDASFFPRLVADPNGQPSLALIHRPLFPGSHPHEVVEKRGLANPANWETAPARKERLHHESIWISYCSPPTTLERMGALGANHRLMSPRASWERIKIGGGAPPILTRHGWLILYHGVSGRVEATKTQLRYSAGAVVLEAEHPEKIRYRSSQPILSPGKYEHQGLVPNVIFPTGTDRRTDIGQPGRIDVYCGISDDRIGVATLTIPEALPETTDQVDEQRDDAAA